MAAKRKHWSRGMTEKNVADEEEELLVFGYSCKLFRDDEKALYIEQGKHLIPWMGEDRLMIDRYDGRGYLHDIEQYEAKPGTDTHEGLTEEEIKIETLCDEERYLALCKDMSEEEMYHEEEMKRLRMALASDGAYNEVNFTYDEESTKDSYDPSEPTDETGGEVSEEPFIAPPELAVPEGMEVPPTLKMNAIIEKTAVFVAQHGIQMEIVIKTKQSKNTQFSFMQFDHPLNPYYKHMITCIKSGKYKPSPQEKSASGKKITNGEDDENTDDEEDENGDGNYLHPSLLVSKAPVIASQTYSTNTYSESYYSLGTPYPSAAPVQAFTSGAVQYQQPQRSSQADDWYSLLVKQLKDKVAKNHSSANSPSNLTPPMGSGSPNATPGMQSEYVTDPTLATSQYPMYVVADPSLPTPPGLEPVTLPTSQNQSVPGLEIGAEIHSSSLNPSLESNDRSSNRGTNNYLLRESHILPPPPDVQPIIDKMASYVAKNGKDFETVVLSKGDKRFEFLHSWHEFHAYYLFKKAMYEQQLRCLERPNELNEGDSNISLAPISFSIKPKEPEGVPLEKRSALSLDENSDSDDGSEKKKEKNEETEKRDRSKERGEKMEKTDVSTTDRKTEDRKPSQEGPVQSVQQAEKSKKTRSEAMEIRIAEEKLKDRLAAAARDKLASASREKQLQLERKRRAALFLTLLKKDKTKSGEISSVIGPQLLPGMVPTSATTTASSNSEEEITEYPPSDGSRTPSERLLPIPRETKSPPANKSDSASPEKLHKESRHHRRSRPRSHSRSRSRSPSYHKRKWRRSSRSRSRHRSRTHKRSRSRSRSKASKAKTPPAAYAVVRRSHSPSVQRPVHRSRSRSRDRGYKRSHARSPSSRGRIDFRYRRSKSPAYYRSWRSRSRSKSRNKPTVSPKMPHRSRSRSRSRSKSSHSHSHHSHSRNKSSKAYKSSTPENKKSPSLSPASDEEKSSKSKEIKSKSRSVSPDRKSEERVTDKSEGS